MSFNIRILPWDQARVYAEPIRRKVFIQEQAVPEALEWDDMDDTATHALAFNDTGEAIGYARLLATKQLGRMAVSSQYRRTGIGTALLQALEAVANKLGYDHLYLHAQIQALSFYEQLGYQSQGEPFDEAGILHLMMMKSLAEKHDRS